MALVHVSHPTVLYGNYINAINSYVSIDIYEEEPGTDEPFHLTPNVNLTSSISISIILDGIKAKNVNKEKVNPL